MALTDDLDYHWDLDENTTGSRTAHDGTTTLDSAGGTGVASTATSVLGRACDFTQGDYLLASTTDVGDYEDNDFTVALWVRFDDFPVIVARILGKWNQDETDQQWRVSWVASTDRLRFQVRNSADSASIVVDADTLGSPSDNTWYFVVCRHDSVNDEISISVNAGTPDTQAFVDGLPTGQTARMGMGKLEDSPTTFEGDAFNGKVDEVSLWSRVLTDDEVEQLYNGGAGLAYPWASSEANLTSGKTSLIVPPFIFSP